MLSEVFWSQHRPHVLQQQNAVTSPIMHCKNTGQYHYFMRGVQRCERLRQTQHCLCLYKCPSLWCLDKHTFYRCDVCKVLIMSAVV